MHKLVIILLIFLCSCTSGTRYGVRWANDLFKAAKTTDKDFTNGVEWNAESPDSSGSTKYKIVQQFYTPGHKQVTTPLPEERPYAGALLASVDYKYRRNLFLQDTVSWTVGAIGPSSLSEQSQNTVHRFLNQKPARGWDNQIHNELGLMLTAERSVATPIRPNYDLVSTLGLNAGNIFTQGYAGAYFRYGYNLPDYFSTSDVIFPRAEIEAKNWSYYLFGGPLGRGVIRNIFLDGNTFRDSASIDKVPFVGELRLGFGVERKRYKFVYTYILQSREWEKQGNNTDFGELAFHVSY